MDTNGAKLPRAGTTWSAVLCGGAGKRLWPLSTEEKPKPFHALCSDKSLLEDTLQRLTSVDHAKTILVGQADNASHLIATASTLNIAARNILLEPQMRNTAASVVLAAVAVDRIDPDATLIVVPSDHFIDDDEIFNDALNQAVELAQDQSLVLLGSIPHAPSSDYGYIVPAPHGNKVSKFVEKPEPTHATDLLKNGALWNCGVFVFKVGAMLTHLKTSEPELIKGASDAFTGAELTDSGIKIHKTYGDIVPQSFDRLVVEAYPSIKFVPLNIKWNDVGSWAALHGSQKDLRGNFLVGTVEQVGTKNCLVHSSSLPVTIENLDGVAIIATENQIFAKALSKQRARSFGNSTNRFSARMRDWLKLEVLPFWLKNGLSKDGVSFVEEVNLDGSYSRATLSLSTLARQVTAYSSLLLMTGNIQCERLARQGMGELFQLLPSYENASAYELSQCLQACAAYFAVAPKASLELAEPVLTTLGKLEIKAGIGFSRNPQQRHIIATADAHMHIVDATQAWMRCTKDTLAKSLASQGWAAFFHHFFDEKNWRVSEVADNAHKAGPWSPGHHFEWARLWIEGGSKDQIVEDFSLAQQLWATATAYGATDTSGLLSILVDGTGPGDAETRAWVIAEQLRTAIALERPATEIERICSKLFEHHIDPAPKGLWYDRLETRQGQCISPSVRASLLHHIVLAAEAYLVWNELNSKQEKQTSTL